LGNVLQFNKKIEIVNAIIESDFINELNKLKIKNRPLDFLFAGEVLICIKNIVINDITIDMFNNILINYKNSNNEFNELIILQDKINTIENNENSEIIILMTDSKISFLVGGFDD